MKKPQILYIEDNHLNIRLIQRNLKMLGYKLMFAEDGEKGLEIAFRELPDMILVDINLPTIDGIEVLKQLKTNPTTQHIPVIVLTADTMAKTRRACEDHQADGFLLKPISRDKFLHTIQRLLPASNKQSDIQTTE